jgi:hypothetical protein
MRFSARGGGGAGGLEIEILLTKVEKFWWRGKVRRREVAMLRILIQRYDGHSACISENTIVEKTVRLFSLRGRESKLRSLG